jgi:hypothetical protein
MRARRLIFFILVGILLTAIFGGALGFVGWYVFTAYVSSEGGFPILPFFVFLGADFGYFIGGPILLALVYFGYVWVEARRNKSGPNPTTPE